MEIEKFYKKGGELNSIYGPTYQPRPKQIEMAKIVGDTISKGEKTIVEAGTGVGKSLAYLIPVAKRILENEERALITVSTKSLQKQLWEDRHILLKIFPQLKISIIKGRENYPCLKKVYNHGFKLDKIIDGDGELKGNIRNVDISSRIETCVKNCIHRVTCVYFKKREEVKKANLVISNNNLSILNLTNANNILGDFDHLVVDESQEFIESIQNTLSLKFSVKGLRDGVKAFIKESEKQISVENLTTLESKIKALSYKLKNGENMELTPKIAERLPILKVPQIEVGTEEQKKLLKSIKSKVDRYNSFIKYAKEEDSTHAYYLLNNKGLERKNIKVEKVFKLIQSNFKSLFFTSATVFTDFKDLSHFYIFTGETFKFNNRVKLGTMFNFPKQMNIFVDPKADKQKTENYPIQVAEIVKLLDNKRKVGEGIVVLFTSKQIMEETARCLPNYNLHIQSSINLDFKNNFIKDNNGILFGLKSATIGMDIKGDKLKYLVIAGLPYKAPCWEYKKIEKYLESLGANPFMGYMLPNMLNTLKQGIGRLIRGPKDTGEVYILDRRLLYLTSFYKNIRAELPTKVEEIELL